MSLLDRVTAVLDHAGARYAVIGAAAMAAHGVARSTHDVDLLTLANVCLDSRTWAPLANAGVDVSVTRGDAADPLAGVVRFDEPGKRPVDLDAVVLSTAPRLVAFSNTFRGFTWKFHSYIAGREAVGQLEETGPGPPRP